MNQNSLAIQVLCSHMASQSVAKPLEPKEWASFADLLHKQGFTPADVLNMDSQMLVKNLGLSDSYATRIQQLRDRSAAIGFELNEYENMGIQFITRADADYPTKIKKKLGKLCPPIFCYAGDLSLLDKLSVGFVGSRNIDEPETLFTQNLVERIVANKYAVVSGGAKGIDSIAMNAALTNGGFAIAFLSDSIMDKLRKRDTIKAVQQGNLLLISSYKPDAPWTVGSAMARNKYIYVQSEGVVVVRSDLEKGGTWSGAVENLRNNWVPVYCWDNNSFPGNQKLIQKGAVPISEDWNGIPSVNDTEKNSNTEIVNEQLSMFTNL